MLEPVLSMDGLLVTDGGKVLARCTTKMNVSQEVLNQSARKRVRGELHIQTVDSLHERIKTSCVLGTEWQPNTSATTSAGSIAAGSRMPQQPEHVSTPPWGPL